VRKSSLYYQPRYTDYILNWGCSKQWDFITHDNKVGHQRVVNKLDFFESVEAHNKLSPAKHVNIPEWTTDPKVVCSWIDTEDKVVVARTILNGHSGAGIKLLGGDNTHVVTYAPLYVQYKKKKHEYRVHIFNSEVIDVTQKKKRRDAEFIDTKIRNHKNGWVYAREDVTEPQDLREQAQRAMLAVSLKFGAVDLIWNQLENKCYVLEINTAPGLVGTTLTNYVQAILKDIK